MSLFLNREIVFFVDNSAIMITVKRYCVEKNKMWAVEWGKKLLSY